MIKAQKFFPRLSWVFLGYIIFKLFMAAVSYLGIPLPWAVVSAGGFLTLFCMTKNDFPLDLAFQDQLIVVTALYGLIISGSFLMTVAARKMGVDLPLSSLELIKEFIGMVTVIAVAEVIK